MDKPQMDVFKPLQGFFKWLLQGGIEAWSETCFVKNSLGVGLTMNSMTFVQQQVYSPWNKVGSNSLCSSPACIILWSSNPEWMIQSLCKLSWDKMVMTYMVSQNPLCHATDSRQSFKTCMPVFCGTCLQDLFSIVSPVTRHSDCLTSGASGAIQQWKQRRWHVKQTVNY